MHCQHISRLHSSISYSNLHILSIESVQLLSGTDSVGNDCYAHTHIWFGQAEGAKREPWVRQDCVQGCLDMECTNGKRLAFEGIVARKMKSVRLGSG